MADSAGLSPLEQLGGEAGIRRWVDRFYDLVAQHPLLVPLFPPDLTESRTKQHAFFVEMFGGPALYSSTYGQPFLRYKHRKFRIGRPERDAWMALAEQSLREQSADGELVAQVVAQLAKIADMMVNHSPEKHDAEFFNA